MSGACMQVLCRCFDFALPSLFAVRVWQSCKRFADFVSNRLVPKFEPVRIQAFPLVRGRDHFVSLGSLNIEPFAEHSGDVGRADLEYLGRVVDFHAPAE